MVCISTIMASICHNNFLITGIRNLPPGQVNRKSRPQATALMSRDLKVWTQNCVYCVKDELDSFGHSYNCQPMYRLVTKRSVLTCSRGSEVACRSGCGLHKLSDETDTHLPLLQNIISNCPSGLVAGV